MDADRDNSLEMDVDGEGEAAQPPTQMLEGQVQLIQSVLTNVARQQVAGARVTSCPFLAGTLTPANALCILAIAEQKACAELADAAARFVDGHFTEVAQTESFAALEADALAALIQRDTLEVSSEVLLDPVLRWARHAPATRVGQLSALLRLVRPRVPPHVNVAGADAGAASRYMRRARSVGHAMARGAKHARSEGRRLIGVAKRAVGVVRRAWRHYRPGAAVRAACAALACTAAAARRLALPPPPPESHQLRYPDESGNMASADASAVGDTDRRNLPSPSPPPPPAADPDHRHAPSPSPPPPPAADPDHRHAPSPSPPPPPAADPDHRQVPSPSPPPPPAADPDQRHAPSPSPPPPPAADPDHRHATSPSPPPPPAAVAAPHRPRLRCRRPMPRSHAAAYAALRRGSPCPPTHLPSPPPLVHLAAAVTAALRRSL